MGAVHHQATRWRACISRLDNDNQTGMVYESDHTDRPWICVRLSVRRRDSWFLLARVTEVHGVDGAAGFPPANQVFAGGALAWIEGLGPGDERA